MPTFTLWAARALSAVLLTVAPWSAPGSAQASGSGTASAVDHSLSDAVESGVPGIAVSVVHDDEIVQVGASGTAGGGAAMTADTPMRIESLSKSFTAAAVMGLVEEEKIELDRPVRDYLPEFTVDDPRAEHITVRHLLTQTSGMSDGTAPPLYGSDATDLQEAVARLSESEPAADPGAEFHYHNPNYHVLARMVEVVAGEDFSEHLEKRIFEPLGMDRTRSTPMAGDEVPGMAQGHMMVYGRALPTEGVDYFSEGSGGIVSTARDMAQWLWMNNNGGLGPDGERILSADSIAKMHRPQSPEGADYGFGWYRAESAEGPPVRTSHSGSGGGFNAYQGLFTDSGYAVVVLTNHGAGLTSPQAGILGQNLLADLDADIPPLSEQGGAVGVDLVLSALLVLTSVAVASGLLRARLWAERHRGATVPRIMLRLAPLASAAVFVASVPALQLAATGRTGPWPVLFGVLPVGAAWLLVLGIGSGAVLAVRIAHLLVGTAGARRAEAAPVTGRL